MGKVTRAVVIPARGGSKRLKKKNMRYVGGVPLIEHTFSAVDGLYDRVIVTSDDPKVLEHANNYNWTSSIVDIMIRPDRLASDTSKVIDTVSYYFDSLCKEDQIWLCLPTCPLRNRHDIISGCSMMTTSGVDGVLSVTDYEFPPQLGMNVDPKTDMISDWHESLPWINGNTRSQDHPRVYRPNGALYGMWSNHFDKVRSFYKGKIGAIYMPRDRSVDVDTLLDIRIADMLLS